MSIRKHKENAENFRILKNSLSPAVPESDIELISRSVHDAWWQERKRQGWKYGKITDRNQKTHESMIPYDSLPENEKELDRQTVRQVISILLSLGYKIEKL